MSSKYPSYLSHNVWKLWKASGAVDPSVLNERGKFKVFRQGRRADNLRYCRRQN